jgi:hypothetical protein
MDKNKIVTSLNLLDLLRYDSPLLETLLVDRNCYPMAREPLWVIHTHLAHSRRTSQSRIYPGP